MEFGCVVLLLAGVVIEGSQGPATLVERIGAGAVHRYGSLAVQLVTDRVELLHVRLRARHGVGRVEAARPQLRGGSVRVAAIFIPVVADGDRLLLPPRDADVLHVALLLGHGAVEGVPAGATSLALLKEVPLCHRWRIERLIEALFPGRHLHNVGRRRLASVRRPASRVEGELPLVGEATILRHAG